MKMKNPLRCIQRALARVKQQRHESARAKAREQFILYYWPELIKVAQDYKRHTPEAGGTLKTLKTLKLLLVPAESDDFVNILREQGRWPITGHPTNVVNLRKAATERKTIPSTLHD